MCSKEKIKGIDFCQENRITTWEKGRKTEALDSIASMPKEFVWQSSLY